MYSDIQGILSGNEVSINFLGAQKMKIKLRSFKSSEDKNENHTAVSAT